MWRKAQHILGVLFSITLLGSPQPLHADSSPKEYLVKAAFMYNFVKFIEWPGAYSTKAIGSMNICTVGKDPFGEALSIIEKESSDKLKLNVKRSVSLSNVSSCHILFVSASEKKNLSGLLDKVGGLPILTVGEMDSFAENGGIVGFVTKKKKIKLVINLEAAQKANLRVDPQLLEIAIHVIGR